MVQLDYNRQKSKPERPRENYSRNVELRLGGLVRGPGVEAETKDHSRLGSRGGFVNWVGLVCGTIERGTVYGENKPKSTHGVLAQMRGLGRNWKHQALGGKVNLNT